MVEIPGRQQRLYWDELIQLKVSCEYVRLHRDRLGRWVTRFAVLRAIASSSAIAAWAVTKANPMLWGAIIAAAQVADALQSAIPFTKRHQAASSLVISLDALFIDARMEWEEVFEGRVDADAITRRWHKLRTLRHELDAKNFPDGLATDTKLLRAAEMTTNSYFKQAFGEEDRHVQ